MKSDQLKPIGKADQLHLTRNSCSNHMTSVPDYGLWCDAARSTRRLAPDPCRLDTIVARPIVTDVS